MQITIELPNDLASHENPAAEALQALALEAYRTGLLHKHQAARLLGMGRIEFSDLLIQHGITDDCYGVEEFLRDVKTSDELRAKGLFRDALKKAFLLQIDPAKSATAL